VRYVACQHNGHRMPLRGDPDNLFMGRVLVPPLGEDVPKAALQRAAADRLDFVALPLAAPGGQGVGANFQPSVYSDLALEAATWRSGVVGAVSESVNPDAATPAVAEVRKAELETELRWAAHLGLRGILLPTPSHASGCTYPRAVNEILLAGLFADVIQDEDSRKPPLAVRVPPSGTGWFAWNRFRSFCDHHTRLAVALELGGAQVLNGKSGGDDDRSLQRWFGEPVRFVILHAAAFKKNAHGYPVLPKSYKALLLGLFDYRVEVILAASEEQGADDTFAARRDYVARLFQNRPPLTEAQRFARSHLDKLQAPLQPLQDNLESETYQVFEADPVKYAQYEEAVFVFLRDRLAAGRTSAFTVMVLGAGRGPLVAASLRAAQRAEATVAIWAVEKNPNAIHTLRHKRRREEDWACVEVVAEDMRSWQAPRKADVIVSELLGSFGDNELSPECIDGAQHLLAEDGVSIPTSYVSSVAPVSCAALWSDARGQGGVSNMPGGDAGQLETGYVVCLHRAFYPASGPKDCFTFHHPNRDSASTNDRSAELAFEAEVDTLVHGFAAYFDCVLYGDVRISIDPRTFSTGMFSWFPMFFPLQVPMLLKKGDVLHSHWWRRHDAKQVWYEWTVSEPTPVAIHNAGGRSWAIGLR